MALPRRDGALSSEPAAGKVEPPSCTPTRFYAYWIFALAAAVSAFASHIYVRQRIVDLGYQLGQERAHRAALENERRDLELELASLEAPADLAQLSRDILGLDVPRDDQMIEVASAGTSGPRPRAQTQVVVPSEPVAPSAVAFPPVGEPSSSIGLGPVAPVQPSPPAPNAVERLAAVAPGAADPNAPPRRHRARHQEPEPAPAPAPDDQQPTADSQQPAPTPTPTPEAAGQQPTANSQQPSLEVAP